MLRFRLRLELSPSGRDEASQTLRSLVGPVRAEPGCSATCFLRDDNDERAVVWVEEWRGREDFERHLHAPTFRKIVAVMELSVRTPSVDIDEVAHRHGFEMVEEVFRQQHRDRVRG